MSDNMIVNSEKMTDLGRLLRKLFCELDAHNIPYCVLRNHDDLPDHTDHDVDLLVSSSDLERYITILHRVIKSTNTHLVRISGRFGFQQTFHYPSTNGKLIQIDCHGNINYRGQKYIDEGFVLQKRIWSDKGFWIASGGSEAAISLMKEYILFGKVKDKGEGKTKKRIAKLVQEAPESFLELLSRFLGHRAAKFVLDCVMDEDWDRLQSKVRYVRSRLFVRSFFRNPFSVVVNWVRFLQGHVFDEIMYPDGLFICLIGPDGAGKSSIAGSLSWDEFGFESMATYHGHFRILPSLKFYYNRFAAIVGLRRMEEPTSVEAARSVDDNPLGFLRAMITVLYYTFEYILGHVVILEGKARRKLIVFDRYFYDYVTSPRFRRVPRFLIRAILRIIPKPDLLICLEGNPGVIYERKRELSYSTLLELQDSYRRIADSFPNGYVCRSDTPFEVTLREVKALIIQRLNERSLAKLRRAYRGQDE